jgi:hypothetical protein
MGIAKVKTGTVTLRDGTRLRFTGSDEKTSYVGVLEVFKNGNESNEMIESDEIHYWLEQEDGNIIYDGHDYKC